MPIVTPGGQQVTQGQVYGSYPVSYQETTTMPDTVSYATGILKFYVRSLIIRVYDANDYRKNGKETLVWAGDVTSTGSSSDFRQVLDCLFVSMFTYFGLDTGKIQKRTLSLSDERVEMLKRIYGG